MPTCPLQPFLVLLPFLLLLLPQALMSHILRVGTAAGYVEPAPPPAAALFSPTRRAPAPVASAVVTGSGGSGGGEEAETREDSGGEEAAAVDKAHAPHWHEGGSVVDFALVAAGHRLVPRYVGRASMAHAQMLPPHQQHHDSGARTARW